MSNNKQSMKLYTEEQVKQMLEVCRDSDLYEHILTFEDILKTETHIELPSEEDIVNKALEIQWSNTLFKDGANYVLNKIQGGNNEQ